MPVGVSLHHGGGVGIGYSIHAGMVIVADGTQMAADKLGRCFTQRSGLGVIKRADAGYELAKKVALKNNLDLDQELGKENRKEFDFSWKKYKFVLKK